MNRRTRSLRYGASIAVALVGVACGALIRGSAGGTAATVLVGIGLVGIVSLVFYEVGLTEDRERAERARRDAAQEAEPHPPRQAAHEAGPRPRADAAQDGEPRPRADAAQDGEPRPPRHLGLTGEHQGARPRRLERRRGQRRRLD